MRRTNKKTSLAVQIRRHSENKTKKSSYDGNTELMLSTGSTLLDLAICGTRIRGGGIPGGILMEMFGPSSSGKTVFLFEIGGYIQRKKGDVIFLDPEARVNKTFAKQFDFDLDTITKEEPDTVTEVMETVFKYKPKNKKALINGIMVDSLAALSTKLEMDNDKGDKMGMRRAKEFSEGLRKVCRLLKQRNQIMICSNQIRINVGASPYSEQLTVPGGKAIGFYSSIRLRFMKPVEVKKEITFKGKKIKGTTGTKVHIKVYKSSVDEGYRTAEVYIMKKYGIDDIRANLQYLKDFNKTTVYCLNKRSLGDSMEKAISKIERLQLESELKEAVIDLWEEIESKFKVKRIKKRR